MTQNNKLNIRRLSLPSACRQLLIDHCRRKLAGDYLDGEEKNLKAFGLLAGERSAGHLTIKTALPLLKNARAVEPHRRFMNRMMEEHAIPSETPLEKRGWVADPEELAEAVAGFSRDGLALVGSYHMHRVAWEHDQIRDTPTTLDTILGRDSRLIMFIVSMVNPEEPIIRAYAEGNGEAEIPIEITEG
jgi:hypothetical protein